MSGLEEFIGGYIGGSDGMRYFKVISVDGKKIKDDDEGRYKITPKSSPGGAARKAFSQLTKKYNTNKIVFVIKETTQGSKKKEYGPYEGIRVQLTTPKKIMYKGSKKPVLIKHEDKIRLIKEVKQKGGLFGQNGGGGGGKGGGGGVKGKGGGGGGSGGGRGPRIFNVTYLYPIVPTGGPEHIQTLKAFAERRSIITNKVYSFTDLLNLATPPHITIIQMFVNEEHQYHRHLLQELGQILKQSFDDHLKDQVQLLHVENSYEKMGNFFSKPYVLSAPSKITDFRTQMYQNIQTIFGFSPTDRLIVKPNNDRYEFRLPNENTKGPYLFSVPWYHYGKENWKAHISLLEFNNPCLKVTNPRAIAEYQKDTLEVLNPPLYAHLKPLIDKINSLNIRIPKEALEIEQINIQIKKIITEIVTREQTKYVTSLNPTEFRLNGITPRQKVMPFIDIFLSGTTVYSIDRGKSGQQIFNSI